MAPYELTIRLPDVPDIVQRLENKVREYWHRVGRWDGFDDVTRDARYKAEIGDRVLAQGEFDVVPLSFELGVYNSFEKIRDYFGACIIIQDYLNTGGAHCVGGTGF